MTNSTRLLLERMVALLEQNNNIPVAKATDLSEAPAFIWQAGAQDFLPVSKVPCVPLALLRDVDQNAPRLLLNTQRFAQGLQAHNALLWGARGMGKSSFIKAVFNEVHAKLAGALALVEIYHEDLNTLPALLARLVCSPRRFILFCDDLSFDAQDDGYKRLKVILEGGIAGRPDNVILYASSNRRHLLAEKALDNEQSTAIHPNEVIEEKTSLSDRFGLWLGFYSCSEQDYLAMVGNYIAAYNLAIGKTTWLQEAKAWAMQRGARSGRVAWQYVVDLAGRQNKVLP